MSLLSDASTALGVPGWAVPICLAIVGLAKLVDGSMRPEAKAEIGAFLERGRIPAEAPSVTGVVRAAFLATFGERQWGWRCLSRTMLLSVFAVYAVCILIWTKHGGEVRARIPDLPSLPMMILVALPWILLFSLAQNWLSVGKTRLVLRWMGHVRGLFALFAFMLLDLVLTYALAMVLYWGPAFAVYGRAALCETTRYYHAAADCSVFDTTVGVVAGIIGVSAAMSERIWFQAGTMTPGNILNYAEGCAMLLTTVWTMLIVVSLAILRLLSPLALLPRAVRWGWDLKASPVMAVGWIVAVVVWVGSLVYAVV